MWHEEMSLGMTVYLIFNQIGGLFQLYCCLIQSTPLRRKSTYTPSNRYYIYIYIMKDQCYQILYFCYFIEQKNKSEKNLILCIGH